jgi:hypothetical protein
MYYAWEVYTKHIDTYIINFRPYSSTVSPTLQGGSVFIDTKF